ncbi:MAG: hypothetical protein HYY62_07010 [Deltaproteobacteria bacterium]|nr:hypothetical protein [Deltaproteobacteria bacterium]
MKWNVLLLLVLISLTLLSCSGGGDRSAGEPVTKALTSQSSIATQISGVVDNVLSSSAEGYAVEVFNKEGQKLGESTTNTEGKYSLTVSLTGADFYRLEAKKSDIHMPMKAVIFMEAGKDRKDAELSSLSTLAMAAAGKENRELSKAAAQTIIDQLTSTKEEKDRELQKINSALSTMSAAIKLFFENAKKTKE